MFDPTKPVRTRCGWKVEIICDDLFGTHPIVAAYWDDDRRKKLASYTRGALQWPGQ
jgi:hypothetical protein